MWRPHRPRYCSQQISCAQKKLFADYCSSLAVARRVRLLCTVFRGVLRAQSRAPHFLAVGHVLVDSCAVDFMVCEEEGAIIKDRTGERARVANKEDTTVTTTDSNPTKPSYGGTATVASLVEWKALEMLLYFNHNKIENKNKIYVEAQDMA